MLICLAALTVLLGACTADAPRVEYNGEQLSQEDIFALADQFRENDETETVTETEEPEETRAPADGIVYWTVGGEVWHEWRSCGHLSRKNEVTSGSIAEAIAQGKERGCSYCTEEQETQ